MTNWRLFYHIVWSTQDRLPLLIDAVEKTFYGVVVHKAEELGVILHAAGNVADHVHIVVSIPPKISISECVRLIKGASAHAINQLPGVERFQWQAGYAVFSFAEDELEVVKAYALGQKTHHRDQNLVKMYEQFELDGY